MSVLGEKSLLKKNLVEDKFEAMLKNAEEEIAVSRVLVAKQKQQLQMEQTKLENLKEEVERLRSSELRDPRMEMFKEYSNTQIVESLDAAQHSLPNSLRVSIPATHAQWERSLDVLSVLEESVDALLEKYRS